jgi:quinol monooxygenase YgiN
MYPLISTWTILPGKEADAIAALKILAIKVHDGEPDTHVYLVHIPDFTQANLPTPPQGEVIFFEIYKDQAAFEAHVGGHIFKTFVKDHGHLFLESNGAPYVTVEMMKHEAGFIRHAMAL